MKLSEQQVKEVERYLKSSKIENRAVLGDFVDHLCCMIEEAMTLGNSFGKSFDMVVEQLSGSKIKSIELFTLKLLNMETTFSPRAALLATSPFALFGLTWVFFNSSLSIPLAILWFSFASSVIFMFGLLCIGWTRDFPRWSFPAIGFCPIFSVFFMMVSIPGFSDGRLGFWAWIPLIASMLIALLLKPSLEPIKNLLKKIKDEPALILFALYGFVPFLLFIMCDEIHSLQIGLVALGATVLLSAGIYLFLRSESRSKRLLSIIASGLLATILVWVSI